MYKGKKILAIITARGGSKRIPGKNIVPLGGRPLIAWTIDAAAGSRYLDRVVCSTDSPKIRDVARGCGCEVPFLRPASLSGDGAKSVDAVLHAMSELPESYDYVLLLQPTSPFRRPGEIDGIIEQGIDQASELTVSVRPARKPPSSLYLLTEGRLLPYACGRGVPRQDEPVVYERDGSLYLASTTYLVARRSYHDGIASAYLSVPGPAVDIDTEDDLNYAKYLLEKRVIR